MRAAWGLGCGAVAMLLVGGCSPGKGGPDISPDLSAKTATMVTVPAGTSRLGSNVGPPDEQPSRLVEVGAFGIDPNLVTVAAFAAFVEDTGHRTDAERMGSGAVMIPGTGIWQLVEGANWRQPSGPNGESAVGDHPVVQISWNDARAYCGWRNARLPTEIEWERAARAGNNADGVVHAYDTAREPPSGTARANVFTGLFPIRDTGADGFVSTSPVGTYPANAFGLSDMAGNVWEWTASVYAPYGDPTTEAKQPPVTRRVARGGSFLCDPKFCYGYRVSARTPAEPDESFFHMGFRCARDIAEASVDRANPA